MNKKFTVLVGLLMAVAVTGYSVSGTYAKYTEDFNGTSSSAQVAKWDVKLSQGSTDLSNTFNFDLMETSSNSSLAESATTKLLAPGSKGHFTIKVANKSDVNAVITATFSLDASSAEVPLTFSSEENGAYGAIDTVNITSENITGKTTTNANGGESEITIYWKWDFDANTTNAAGGKDDTALGKEAGTVIVKANVTVSQATAA